MHDPHDEHEPVTVYIAQGESEAQIYRSLLEAQGIRAALKGEALRQVYGFTLDGLGKVEVQVAPADVERAQALIAEVDAS